MGQNLYFKRIGLFRDYLLFALVPVLLLGQLRAQSCLPDGIYFATQQDVDLMDNAIILSSSHLIKTSILKLPD